MIDRIGGMATATASKKNQVGRQSVSPNTRFSGTSDAAKRASGANLFDGGLCTGPLAVCGAVCCGIPLIGGLMLFSSKTRWVITLPFKIIGKVLKFAFNPKQGLLDLFSWVKGLFTKKPA